MDINIDNMNAADNISTMTSNNLEADLELALCLQPTCKGSNPSVSEKLAQSGHIANIQPVTSEDATTINDKEAYGKADSTDETGNQPKPARRRKITSIWIPYLVVLVPTVILPWTLIGFVLGFEVDPGVNLFPFAKEPPALSRGYYLVAFSVTRLAIISSCASTLAPFLTAPTLILWRIHTIRSVKRMNVQDHGGLKLAAGPQLTALLGLLVGSPEELFKYLLSASTKLLPSQLYKKKKPIMWRPVHFAALIAASCIVISLLMWTADTVFHTYSDSVNIETFGHSLAEIQSHGYDLTPVCKSFDRCGNAGLPCTWDLSDYMSLLEFNTRANEIFRIGTNVSEYSQIQTLAPGLSILLPQSSRVSNTTDYKASTFAVVATCRPITEICKMQALDTQTFTMFNCSDEFRGVIGEVPVVSTTQNFTILDPDTPPLDFKPSGYLQYGFYEDANLSTPYNSVGYNVSEPSWAVNFASTSCPTDASIPATAHMGVAGRFSASSALATANLSTDAGLFSSPIYSDFAFHCTLSAHSISYIWASGTIRNYATQPADASLLNMYIGQLLYYAQAAGDDMTSDILQMALQPSSQAMADTWARLFSTRVLAVIAGYTAPLENEAQQTRTTVLVARVHKGSMWFLVGCSLGTAVFVSWIALRGRWIVGVDHEALEGVEWLTYEGQLKHQDGGEGGEEQEVGGGKKDGDEKTVASGETKAGGGSTRQSRSYTGCSSATTVVPIVPPTSGDT